MFTDSWRQWVNVEHLHCRTDRSTLCQPTDMVCKQVSSSPFNSAGLEKPSLTLMTFLLVITKIYMLNCKGYISCIPHGNLSRSNTSSRLWLSNVNNSRQIHCFIIFWFVYTLDFFLRICLYLHFLALELLFIWDDDADDGVVNWLASWPIYFLLWIFAVLCRCSRNFVM
jgi:hypothetical protein